MLIFCLLHVVELEITWYQTTSLSGDSLRSCLRSEVKAEVCDEILCSNASRLNTFLPTMWFPPWDQSSWLDPPSKATRYYLLLPHNQSRYLSEYILNSNTGAVFNTGVGSFPQSSSQFWCCRGYILVSKLCQSKKKSRAGFKIRQKIGSFVIPSWSFSPDLHQSDSSVLIMR